MKSPLSLRRAQHWSNSRACISLFNFMRRSWTRTFLPGASEAGCFGTRSRNYHPCGHDIWYFIEISSRRRRLSLWAVRSTKNSTGRCIPPTGIEPATFASRLITVGKRRPTIGLRWQQHSWSLDRQGSARSSGLERAAKRRYLLAFSQNPPR